jgi:hypothetical protein
MNFDNNQGVYVRYLLSDQLNQLIKDTCDILIS